MKFIAAVLLLSALCAANAADDAGNGQSRALSAGRQLIGQPGPNASLTTLDGKTIELASLYGKKPVYLKFWATWCVPCREQMPGFEQIYQKYGSRIAVVAVNTGFSETEADVRSYRSKHGLHMPIVIDDGSLAGKLNLRVTPQHVLIGADGRIVHVGHLADRQLDEALEKVVSEKPAPMAILPAQPLVKPRVFKVGEEVSGIAAETIAGRPLSFAPGGSGKPRALVFFSPWCESYLRESRPATAQACARVRKEAESLAMRGDVEWVGVSAPLWASAGELAEYAKLKKAAMPLVLDKTGALFAAFGIRQIPSVVLIDATGRMVKVLGPEDRGIAKAVQSLALRQRLASR